ncbi:phosphatidate phosphatase LPIN3 isoform X2 [Cimex lectularius]|uniref:phosphatidate phosphatase n=1 Tax=Cimex lectularius TaxID=79782 RepID=A0A8I6SNJ3_CIMLE|nr:phosphatidate phosphatase LPIN3 isoform X2 [Cimex lectularius]
MKIRKYQDLLKHSLKMNYLGKVINNCKYIYNEINAATLTGAIDVVVVEQPDGSYTCSPFHVRFGKMGVLRSKEKIVDIEINGEPVDIHMKLGESGEAFFVEEVEVGEGEEGHIPPHLACSPIPPEDYRYNTDWPRYEEGEENCEKEIVNIGSSTPKTFRAETLSKEDNEIVRKLSTTEFRPIPGQHPETSNSSQESTGNEFNKEDSPSADERVSTSSIGGGNNNKRKRRKKSTKKKGAQKRGSASSGSQMNDDKTCHGEVIFQIEDLDGAQQLTIVEKDESKAIDVPTTPQQLERDIHFFSDTEITPGSRCKKEGESELDPGFQLLNATHIINAFPRDFAPVQSDSEFETKRTGGEGGQSNNNEDQPQSWRWGELPTSPNNEENKQESQKWMLQNMLGFMKKTKHMRHKNESEGIYLSELNSEDPEIAALYFPSTYKQNNTSNNSDYVEQREEDTESGNGPSLPQSPHSVEGAICGPKSIDSDFEHHKWCPEDVAISTAGANATSEQFNDNMISYDDLCQDPLAHLNNPKLVVRIDGKLYSWHTAAPIILSMFVYHKGLPQEVISRLCEGENEGKELKDTTKQPKKPYTSWFNWSRANPPTQKFDDNTLAEVKIDESAKPSDLEQAKAQEVPKRPDSIQNLQVHIPEQPLDMSIKEKDVSSHENKLDDSQEVNSAEYNSEKYRKTLRLTSQQIASLKLQPGANEIVFSVTTAYQGTSKCSCYLFCWRYDDKIVISDIDGTITKSDVLGHILPIVGKDWAQSGVAKLFTKIKDNGYKLLYLSARAIGQSRLTREYLKSIKQEDLGLPEGPMLLNPTSLLNAFHTEVIEKKPEEFKISCLKDIQALFPSHIKPFYAGYGNKINDVWAYQAVGVPIFRIFTINHRGELKHELTQTFQSTYSRQSSIVNDIFPAKSSTIDIPEESISHVPSNMNEISVI